MRWHCSFNLPILCLFLFVSSSHAAINENSPNFILINTDDLNVSDIAHMPLLQEYLVDKGVTYVNAFVPDSICCPSRVSLLRAQYSHNHGVLSNQPPSGSFEAFMANGLEQSTIATWMKDAGYTTGLYGKFLNRYPFSDDQTYVPPGWTNWHALLQGTSFYNYTLNHNGSLQRYGSAEEDYITDVISELVLDDISAAVAQQKPFFFYLATSAPHTPAYPAPRHEGAFDNLLIEWPPSFNEADISDKPAEYQKKVLNIADVEDIERLYKKRLASMLSIDEMILAIVGRLESEGELDNTYIIFTSDNGQLQGEHRLEGKALAYEEAISVPLVVRGPGISEGKTLRSMTLNIDIAPTISKLAGVQTPSFIDGKILPKLFSTGPEKVNPTKYFLIERLADIDNPELHVYPYLAVRTTRWLYVEHDGGARELYNLRDDPYQLENVFGSTAQSVTDMLGAMLDSVRYCQGSACSTY